MTGRGGGALFAGTPLFRDAPIGMLLAGEDGAVRTVNRAWCELSGLSGAASLGDGWLSVLPRYDQGRVRELLAGAKREPPHRFLDACLVPASPVRWGRFTASRTVSRDGEHAGLLIAFADVSADRALMADLHHAATHDPLTGAANRSLFLADVRHALARLLRHPGLVGVLYLDLDDFKAVNDRRGHGAGDHVLVAQTQRLREAVRPTDVLGRLGGDEFAVLCEDLEGLYQMELIAGRIADRLAEPIVERGESIAVSPSIGAVVTSAASASAERLIDLADRAMYRAKINGGPPEVVVDVSGDRAQAAAPRPGVR